MPSVHVHLLPELCSPQELTGCIAVVIDILRASTTIVHAIASGAKEVVPAVEVESARETASRFPLGSCLLGGERRGTTIPGFDLDNSPGNYTAERIAGRTVIFTTTNGTRALARCRPAKTILVGAFVNRMALIRKLNQSGLPIHLICAGTDGCISMEDVLFAGSIADDFAVGESERYLDDESRLAVAFWRSIKNTRDGIRDVLKSSRGGRNLMELNFGHDIERAALCDLFNVVPEWHSDSNTISRCSQDA